MITLALVMERYFNGADDNASGVCALLAAAAYFKANPPEHSLIFVAFDAEELGLQGAVAFVNEGPIDFEKVVANVNLDMISRNEKNEIYLCGTHHSPFLKDILAPLQQRTSVNIRFGHDTPDLGPDDWTRSSDHFAFFEKKIPFIYLGVEDHEDYHKATDDFENIEPQFFLRTTELVIDVVLAFDDHNWKS